MFLLLYGRHVCVPQAPVVQRLYNAIHRINHYPADSVVCFVNTYPLDSDLSGGYRYPAFEQPGPDIFFTVYGYITSSQSAQLPDGSIAQLVQHCIGIAEVMSSTTIQA